MAEEKQKARQEKKINDEKKEKTVENLDKGDKKPEKKEDGAKEKRPAKTKPRVKKTNSVVNSFDLPISTKESVAICRFINGKKIEDAIKELEKVTEGKKAVPMKGELPHRRGKGMMSGRYPKKSARFFIKALKSLSGNSSVNEIDNPIIVEAVANIGQRQYGRFGSIRRKRTHLRIVAKNKMQMKELKK